MGWLIVLACVALLVGSVAMLRPSPRERRQSRLRTEAFRAGLRVRLQEVMLPGEAEPRRLAAYTLAREPAAVRRFSAAPVTFLLVRAPGGGLDQVTAGWQFLESDRGARQLAGELGELVDGLSPEFLGVASTSAAVAVYWTEQGGEASIAEVSAALRALARLTVPE